MDRSPIAAGTDAFDREWTLAELLAHVPREPLARGLTGLLGEAWMIAGPAGECLLGRADAATPGAARQALRHEGEVVGHLVATAAPLLAGAAALVHAVLLSAQRYHMAMHVHEAAVAADYAALRAKHAELERSEARYRQLAGQLEQRVAEQVATIETAQRQLFQAERMASVGQLAAGMAHEINNPIGFIRSNLATASEYVQQLGEVLGAYRAGDAGRAAALWQRHDVDFVLGDHATLLAESIDGADRIARIVANLKAFSNIDNTVSADIDPNDCLRSTAAVAESLVSGQQRLALALAPVPRVCCDAALLNQVLLSLVQNALAALGEAGTVTLSSGCQGADLQLAVADTGCGMDAATLARIFDPFFTTREVGQGTGLGLTVSRDIVAGMGGRIEVQSTPGRGSTFTILLPLGTP